MSEVNATTPATSGHDGADLHAGLSTASAAGSMINLSWTAANDAVTGAAQMVYNIYLKRPVRAGRIHQPDLHHGGRTDDVQRRWIDPGQTSYFVVRAQDQAGNIDSNKNEKIRHARRPSFRLTSFRSSPTTAPNAGCHNNRNPAGGA